MSIYHNSLRYRILDRQKIFKHFLSISSPQALLQHARGVHFSKYQVGIISSCQLHHANPPLTPSTPSRLPHPRRRLCPRPCPHLCLCPHLQRLRLRLRMLTAYSCAHLLLPPPRLPHPARLRLPPFHRRRLRRHPTRRSPPTRLARPPPQSRPRKKGG